MSVDEKKAQRSMDAKSRLALDQQRKAGAATQTFLGKGSTGCANASGMFDTSKEIVKCAEAGSAAQTMMGMGSVGHATQAGMVDTRRNIVKAC